MSISITIDTDDQGALYFEIEARRDVETPILRLALSVLEEIHHRLNHSGDCPQWRPPLVH